MAASGLIACEGTTIKGNISYQESIDDGMNRGNDSKSNKNNSWLNIDQLSPKKLIKRVINYGIDKAYINIKRAVTAECMISSENVDLFHICLFWLYKKRPEIFQKNVILMNSGLHDSSSTLVGKGDKIGLKDMWALSPPFGEWFIKIDNVNYVKVTIASKFGKYNYESHKLITFNFIGPNATQYLEKFVSTIVRMSDNVYEKENMQRMIDCRGRDSAVPKKSFESVIIPEDDLIKVKETLDRWESQQSIYEKMGITYKVGFLFYGEPGTGKSSLVKAIASYLKKDILLVDASRLEQMEERIRYESTNSIIVFEDIDLMFDKKNVVGNDNSSRQSSLARLNKALQMLDGLLSPGNSIIIATTNKIDDLDDNMLREGRFDVKIEFHNFNEIDAKRMCDHFDVDYGVLEGEKFPLSPTTLQNKILRYIFYNGTKTQNQS